MKDRYLNDDELVDEVETRTSRRLESHLEDIRYRAWHRFKTLTMYGVIIVLVAMLIFIILQYWSYSSDTSRKKEATAAMSKAITAAEKANTAAQKATAATGKAITATEQATEYASNSRLTLLEINKELSEIKKIRERLSNELKNTQSNNARLKRDISRFKKIIAQSTAEYKKIISALSATAKKQDAELIPAQ